MDIIVCDMSLIDITAAADISRQCLGDDWRAESLQSAIKNPQYRFFSAKVADSLVGFCGFRFVLDEGDICTLAVKPDFHRGGIGKALLTAMIDCAHSLPLSFLSLEVRASNAPAIALYNKFGFVKQTIRKNFYQQPAEDAIILIKHLR